jgi:transmembrane sensor
MAADSRNKALLMEMAELWDNMDAMARLSELFPHTMEEARQKRKPWLAAAAVALVAVIVGLMSVLLIPASDDSKSQLVATTQVGTYETAIGGISTVRLSDGSQLTLNTNSHLDVEFTELQRIIRLQRGEFHIDVAHEPSRPLRVIAAGQMVQAVGTAFTVKIDDDQHVELLVVDGIVKVGVVPEDLLAADDSNAMVHYSKGERIVLNAAGDFLETLAPDEIEVQLSWREGNLIFDGETLGDAISEISRYTTSKFIFVDEDLQRIRVAGLFKAGDVAGFLVSLRANFDIAYEHVGDDTIKLSTLQEDTT